MPDDYDPDRADRTRRRRDRDDHDRGPPEKQVSVLGIFALVQGIGSFVVSLVPCIGAVGIVGGVFGLLLGLIALLLAKNSGGKVGLGMPVAAISVNVSGMIVAGAWIALLAGAFERKPAPTPAPDPEPVAKKADPVAPPNGAPLRVTADDLDDEFDDDPQAADAKYKNKAIEVTGTVHRVVRDPDAVTVELSTDDGNSTVDCEFTVKDASQVATLKKGSAVVIRGTCVGLVDGTVTLERCRVVK